MAIRFTCKRCNHLLGIATRKAGTEIECPKCGLPQIVPSEEAAAAALAMSHFSLPQEVVESASDVMVYDDEPAPIDVPRRREAGATATTSVGPAPAEVTVASGRPVPKGKILYSRWTLYAQGILFLLLAAVAFGSGYFIGRGDASFELKIAHEEAAKQRVLVDGTLTYHPSSTQVSGDESGVFIALPKWKKLDKPISVQGLRPQDPPPADSDENVRRIEELGGVYARAGDEGKFSLIFPEQGEYHVLLLSGNTSRPDEEPIEELDLDEMKKYFRRAEYFVGSHKYSWALKEINVGLDSIEHDFGRDKENDQDQPEEAAKDEAAGGGT